MEIHEITRTSLKKLAVSKSRSQRGAVVHNTAIGLSLEHRLKTMDDLKAKSKRAVDFEQQKFLESMSSSSENLRKLGLSDSDLPRAMKNPKQTQRPQTSKSDLGLHEDYTLHRSKSLSSGKSYKQRKAPEVSVLELYDISKQKRKYSNPEVDKNLLYPEYSISSNMKISDSGQARGEKTSAWTPRKQIKDSEMNFKIGSF